MHHLSLPRSLLILHHNHLFQIESDQRRARNFRQRFQFLKALADPSLWPFKTGPNSWDNDFKSELEADQSLWHRNHNLTSPCQSLWQLIQIPDVTISNEKDQQMQKGSGSETPSQTHPPWWRFVKMPQEHDRNFIYMTFPGWSKWGRDKSGSLFEFPRWLVPLLPDTVYLVTSWAAQLMWSKLVKS